MPLYKNDLLNTKLFVLILCLVFLSSCTAGQEAKSGWQNNAHFNYPKHEVKPGADNSSTMAGSMQSDLAPVAANSAGSKGLPLTGKLFENEKRSPLPSQKIESQNLSNVSEGDAALNFVNADIRDVCKAVLGDMFGMNYTISPAVQGTISLKINQALPRDHLLSALDTVFRMSGAAILQRDGLVSVLPVADVPRQGFFVSISDQARSQPGFGMQIVSLHNISAEEMQRLLSPVVPSGSIIPVDSTSNVLVINGSEADRVAMINVIRAFDVDWLTGKSFGLFPVKETSVKRLVSELSEIFGTKVGTTNKLVKFISLERLNAVLVISPEQRYIKEVKAWIDRLDVDSTPMDQKIWVYSVQNGRASDIAKTLDKLSGSFQVRTGANILPLNAETTIAPPSISDEQGQVGDGGSLNQRGLLADSGNNVKFIADEATNSLIILGTKEQFSVVEEALRKLDIVPLQVRIEAAIAEVTLNKDLNYGVQYLFNGRDGSAVFTKSEALSVSPSLPGFSAFVTRSRINVVLDLLQSVTKVQVISSPQLMVLNNQTATLQVGDQVPIVTQTAVSVATTDAPVVNSIQMKDTGVILKVTPRVNSSGMVILDISQEVSDVSKTTTSDLNSPTIQQRKISSTIAVRDGETIALGGLIKDNVTDGRDGLPILQDIPVFGSLFGATTEGHSRTELIALITPRVVKSEDDVRDVTNEMCQKIYEASPLITHR